MRIFLFLTVAILLPACWITPSWSQTCGAPVPETVISSESFGEMNIKFFEGSWSTYSGDSVSICLNGLTVELDIDLRENGRSLVSVWNSSQYNRWGPGVMYLSSYNAFEEQVNMDALPEDVRNLWEQMQDVVSELIVNPDFWKFLDYDEDEEAARNVLQKIRDGYHSPSSYDLMFSIQRSISCEHQEGYFATRGYHISMPDQINISTSDPPDTEFPILRVVLEKGSYMNRWEFMLDPIQKACMVCINDSDPSRPVQPEDWDSEIENLLSRLRFVQNQIPVYVDAGILENPEEFLQFIDLSITGLVEYERIANYQYTYSETIL